MTLKPISNPPNHFHKSYLEWIDAPPVAQLRVYEEHSKSILSKNDSPDIPFRWSINPYRGCFHACAYCYARPSHQYLDFGAGSDFETRIVVKVDAPILLRKAFMAKSWQGEPILFSGNTDCYQPLELSYELTRSCLKVCHEFKNPVMLITKGAIIRRDIDILSALSRDASAHVVISLAFSDDKMAKEIEPGAPRPSVRLRALKELSDAGIQTGIALAPVIPGLNDSQIPELLERAKEAGASSAFITLLRLPAEVKEIFSEKITNSFPSRALKILNQTRDMKSGQLNRSEFGTRMSGDGARWDAIEWLFNSTCKKLGLNNRDEGYGEKFVHSTFERPSSQLKLL